MTEYRLSPLLLSIGVLSLGCNDSNPTALDGGADATSGDSSPPDTSRVDSSMRMDVGGGDGGSDAVVAAGPAFFSSFCGADWRDDARWEAVGGSNHDTYLQTFTTSVDADVPGGCGLRTRGPDSGQNGDDFWNVITPTSSARPPTPEVGQSITWRYYYKLISGDGDGDYHPIDWGTALLNSSPDFAVLKFVWLDDAWQPQIDIRGAPFSWYATPGAILAPDTWYRFEIGWNRTGPTSWTASYRIYDPGGELIVDADDMLANFGSDAGNALSGATFDNPNPERSAMLEIGSPGVGGLVGSPHEAERYAAVAAFVGAPVEDVPYVPARGW